MRLLLGLVMSGALASAASGCGTAGYAQVRRDASERWGCAQSEVDVEPQGGDVVRASGCGKTLIYVCPATKAPAGDPHTTTVTEEEARFGGTGVGECHPR